MLYPRLRGAALLAQSCFCASIRPLESTQFASKLCYGAMHIIHFLACGITEYLAIKSGHLLLRETKVGACFKNFALTVEIRFRALRFEERCVRGLDP